MNKKLFFDMEILDTYIGISPYSVEVDDSEHLRALAEKARALNALPFAERLEAVKQLTLDAMVNAYEGMVQTPDRGGIDIDEDGNQTLSQGNLAEIARFRDIVFKGHSLGYALEQEAGCCRYQATLFFVLGYEADLGDQHFLQSAPVQGDVNTVFNDVHHDGELHRVRIFRDSLRNESLDYIHANPKLFEQIHQVLPGRDFFSYHRNPEGSLVMVVNPSEHARQL